jgi:hypothetical protein
VGLRDIKLPSETITVTDDDSFVVRGLGARDIIDLVQKYQVVAQPIFDQLTELKASNSEDPEVNGVMKTIISTVLRSAPDLLSEIIATAADDIEPEGIAAAARLPPTVQIIAVERIFFLTFRTEAERKNAVETVTRAIQGAAGILNSVTNRR